MVKTVKNKASVKVLNGFSINGNRFKCRILEPGLASYRELGQGLRLLNKDVIDSYAQTFVGTPLTITHRWVNESNRTRVENGIVESVSWNPDDGGYWAEGNVSTEEAKSLIESGWFASCAYEFPPDDDAGPGVHNGVPYDSCPTSFIGNHIAIVKKPRYTKSVIVLNGLPEKSMNWFKKLFGNGDEKPESADGVKVENGFDPSILEGFGAMTINEIVDALIETGRLVPKASDGGPKITADSTQEQQTGEVQNEAKAGSPDEAGKGEANESEAEQVAEQKEVKEGTPEDKAEDAAEAKETPADEAKEGEKEEAPVEKPEKKKVENSVNEPESKPAAEASTVNSGVKVLNESSKFFGQLSAAKEAALSTPNKSDAPYDGFAVGASRYGATK